ncbi:hypothetical protein D3C75_1088990 [compost metagenome]
MRVLLYKAVCHLTNAFIETVSGVERTLCPFAKVLGKCCGQRQFGPAETVYGLPVITHGKQASLFVLFT